MCTHMDTKICVFHYEMPEDSLSTELDLCICLRSKTVNNRDSD